MVRAHMGFETNLDPRSTKIEIQNKLGQDLKEINRALKAEKGRDTNSGRGQPSSRHMCESMFFETIIYGHW